jgi:hypothetical protein
MGKYARCLEVAFDLFPRKNLFMVYSEELAKHTERVMAGASQFLGLDDPPPETVKKRSRRDRRPMRQETRKKLVAKYEPHIMQLLEIVDGDQRVRQWLS